MMSPPQSEKASHTLLSSAVKEQYAPSGTIDVESLSSQSRKLSSEAEIERHHLELASEELGSLSILVKGIKNEIAAYSQLERDYMQQLEGTLARDMANDQESSIPTQLAASQIRRLRQYKKEALAQLSSVNMKIAQLESRFEKISNEAAESDLNVRLYELQMLYGKNLAETAVSTENRGLPEAKPRTRRNATPKVAAPEKLTVTVQEPRKVNRKTASKPKRSRSSNDRAGRQKNPPRYHTADGSNSASNSYEEHTAPPLNDSSIDDISLSDVGADSDASQLLSPSIQTVDEENSHTGAYGSESTARENLQSVESAVDDDDSDDVDIKSIMTSVQEQSEPLPMPELDLDESLTGEAGHAPPAEGKKRHWGIHFSLGKKKEMK